MKKYTIGLITGALLGISTMMFIGAQNKNLGDIVVNSITVLDDGNGGFIKTSNADGKQTVYLGTATLGFGFIKTFNKHEVLTGYFGTNIDNDGMIALYDRYGDGGWAASGKQ